MKISTSAGIRSPAAGPYSQGWARRASVPQGLHLCARCTVLPRPTLSVGSASILLALLLQLQLCAWGLRTFLAACVRHRIAWVLELRRGVICVVTVPFAFYMWRFFAMPCWVSWNLLGFLMGMLWLFSPVMWKMIEAVTNSRYVEVIYLSKKM